jgi:hypothetical protein
VGHTFGPHNQHMAEKLGQIDAALSTTLELMDESKDCHLALIFGDHGMTEDGNHGGGTEEEINAALFAHFSPACGAMALDLAPQMGSKYIEEAFQSINQIDLVPTISVLLGLPIPYANIGGIVPSLLGLEGVRETAAALALNAAQVWRYFTVYSETANKLPNLPQLEEQLNQAIYVYKEALGQNDADDSNAFYKACGLFKVFLLEASELGHRVWTRFDTTGMILGCVVIFIALAASIASLFFEASSLRIPRAQFMEIGLASVFGFFQIGMLSFSNSYIEAEQSIVMFMMAVIGVAVFIRMHGTKAGGNARVVPFVSLLVPCLSRLSESFVSGHGLDASIRLHPAHSLLMFLPALICLMVVRIHAYRIFPSKEKISLVHCAADCLFMILLGLSWIEKRNIDQSRHGFLWARGAVALLLMGVPLAIYDATASRNLSIKGKQQSVENAQDARLCLEKTLAIVSKLLLALMLVTGPSTGSTIVVVVVQGWMLFILGGATGFYEVVSSCVVRLCHCVFFSKCFCCRLF